MSRRRDRRRTGSAPKPPAHEAGRIGWSLASRSRTSRSAAAPHRRPPGRLQPGGQPAPGAASTPGAVPAARPPCRPAPGQPERRPGTLEPVVPAPTLDRDTIGRIGQLKPKEAVGLAGVLVPVIEPMNESEAAGLPKDYKAYKLNMQQAWLLALINGRYYQYQLEAALLGCVAGDAPAVRLRAAVLRGAVTDAPASPRRAERAERAARSAAGRSSRGPA